MRKLDNRGFAFSTMLYGLMLLGIMIIFVIMSTMQTNRQTNKEFVSKIEEELNRYSLTETTLNASSSSVDAKEYIVPIGESGWYKIELWGAAGGGSNGGYGAYTSGIIWLEENRHLYFYIGNKGICGNPGSRNTDFNGAGIYGVGASSCSGGGATDVRLRDGAWDHNLAYRIMVAGGGGGAGQSGSAGHAGGMIGYPSSTGISGGVLGNGKSTSDSSFGHGGNATNSGANKRNGGGGGGWFGGAGGSSNASAGGGSSYISGYAGSYFPGQSGSNIAINPKIIEEQHLAAAAKAAGTYDVGNLSEYFVNGFMLSGVNTGDGQAKIRKISSGDINHPPAISNPDFNNTYNRVKDCVSSMSSGSNTLAEIQVMYRGRNLLASGDVTHDGIISNSGAMTCTEYSFPTSRVDEVAVWHRGTAVTTAAFAQNHTLYLRNTSTGANAQLSAYTDSNMRDSSETSVGFHYSAWNPKVNSSISDGTYYIQSANGDNVFLTKGSGNQVKADFFRGDNTQKWVIQNLGGGYYKIYSSLDLNNNTTLQIADGASYSGSSVNISEFVGQRVNGFDWEKWKFSNAGNGTFYISSGYNTYLAVNQASYISKIVRGSGISSGSSSMKVINMVNAGANPSENRSMRFRILNADY